MESTQLHERFCLSCRHSLRGIDSRRCPECGREFDLDDTSTTAASASRFNLENNAEVARKLVWIGTTATIVFAFISAVGTDRVIIWMIGVLLTALAIPMVMCVWTVAFWPRTPFSRRYRMLAIIVPILALLIPLTNWPLRFSALLHRPLFNALADEIEAGQAPPSPLQVGLFHVKNTRHRPDLGSVGFQLSGDAGGGVFLVRCPTGSVRQRGASPIVWYNTNWEVDLGGGWFWVYED